MKRIIIILVVLLCGCKKDSDVSPSNTLESNTWKLTSMSSTTDASLNMKVVKGCENEVWAFNNGKATTTPNGYSCYYSDLLGNTNYWVKDNKIYFSANSMSDPDTEADISFSGDTMKWYFLIDLSSFGGPKEDYTLIFTKQTAVITTNTTSTTPTNTTVPKDMMAYYPFNGNPNDESGNKNNGIIKGSPTLTNDRFEKANKAYQFNDGGYIVVPNHSSLKLTKAFSYTVWVKMVSRRGYDGFEQMQSSGNTHTIFSKDCDRGSFSTAISTDIDYSFNFSAGQWFADYGVRVPFALNEWVCFSAVYDGTQLKLFRNGTSIGSHNVTIDFSESNAADLYIGKMGCYSYFFNGAIDDLRLYNRALTDAEVKEIYKAEKT
jgi:Concanavalin A-like lectin/glucanases superfamily